MSQWLSRAKPGGKSEQRERETETETEIEKKKSKRHYAAAEGERHHRQNLTGRPQPHGNTQINKNRLI